MRVFFYLSSPLLDPALKTQLPLTAVSFNQGVDSGRNYICRKISYKKYIL